VKRVAAGLLALGLAGAGLLAAGVLAGPTRVLDVSTDTTETTETTAPATTAATTEPTVPPTTTAPPTTTTATTATTAPPPVPPKPKPKPVAPRPLPRIASGVTVAGVHVGGLGSDAAYQAVRLAFESPLVLVARTQRISVSAEELGAVAYVRSAVAGALHAAPRTTVTLRVRVEGSAVRGYVAELAKRLDRKPVDASVLLRNLQPVVTKSAVGWRLDRKAAERALVSALVSNRRGAVRLPLRKVQPEVAKTTLPIVVIHRDSNTLYLYNGEKLTREFHVATGQSAYSTPLGRFSVVVKWRNPWWYPPSSPWAKGARPIPPGPGNPLGTRWMGLSSPGVGIHGTPDAASIGYSLSHGCIRMLIPDAEWLFDHVEIATPVFIVAA
jgi:lipoprotein-anchoring transpeptidase ErfK/SrfK